MKAFRAVYTPPKLAHRRNPETGEWHTILNESRTVVVLKIIEIEETLEAIFIDNGYLASDTIDCFSRCQWEGK